MNISLRFDYNKLNLSVYDSFIPNKLISNHKILSLDYVVKDLYDNDLIINRFDFELLDNVYDVKDVGALGEYIYYLPNAIKTCNNAYFKINAMRSTNAIIEGALVHGVPSNVQENTVCNNPEVTNYKSYEFCLFKYDNAINIESKFFYLSGLSMNKVNNIYIMCDNELHSIELTYIGKLTWYYTIENYNSDIVYTLNINVNKPFIITVINKYINTIHFENDYVINTSNMIPIPPINKHIPILNKMARVNLNNISKQQCISKNIKTISRYTDKECPIEYKIINNGLRYMQCEHCNNCYSYNNINKWLKINKSCPMCRHIWTDNNIYINLLDSFT